MRDRSFRRFQSLLTKKRSEKTLTARGQGGASPREIGRFASVHGAQCSCSMCGNPRKFYGDVTTQEKRALENEKDS